MHFKYIDINIMNTNLQTYIEKDYLGANPITKYKNIKQIILYK